MNIWKKLRYIFIFVSILLVSTGCTARSDAKELRKAGEGGSKSELGDEVDPYQSDYEKTSSLNINTEDDITPYQLLYFIWGNGEEISFSYAITRGHSQWVETHFFQRKGEASVDSFTTHDMNGNEVSVREVEKDGKVHYILDDSKHIKTYLAPAEDFLIYRMIIASKTPLKRGVEEDGYLLYEYTLPFEQDETMEYKYCFYMKDNILRKLTVSLGDGEGVTYTFTAFQQAIADTAAFELPLDYVEENYNDSYTWETMPPWWEVGNDE